MTKRKILEKGTKGKNRRRKRYNWRREIKRIRKETKEKDERQKEK